MSSTHFWFSLNKHIWFGAIEISIKYKEAFTMNYRMATGNPAFWWVNSHGNILPSISPQIDSAYLLKSYYFTNSHNINDYKHGCGGKGIVKKTHV